MIKVEVVYASCKQQLLKKIQIKKNSSVEEAIFQSNILQHFPEINLSQNKVGIFNRQVNLHATVEDGDRVEIYRPLIIDPKTARRIRAKK